MDQTNPLAELTHKRRLSALGPGGFTEKELDLKFVTFIILIMEECVRLKLLKVQTLVLLAHLATYARINEYGFIETPYRRVDKETGNSY